jgi:hypothetical protein
MDPMHALGVAPLGIWLGVIAWRADSIWPAVFGHVGNNAFAVMASVLMGQDASPEQPAMAVLGVVVLISLLSFLGCLVLLALGPRLQRVGGAHKLPE